jgi:chromosomal replication initiation ATPase DnaA
MQFAAGREDIQKELFDTMQALTRHGKQIVMAGDMKPQEIIGLTDDIVCVMHESVVAQMRVPEFDCRLKIVQALMKELNINLDNDSGSSLLISD